MARRLLARRKVPGYEVAKYISWRKLWRKLCWRFQENQETLENENTQQSEGTVKSFQKMAGARKTADQKSLAKLKEEVGELLANESGRIDGGLFKQKYKKCFGKDFKTPKSVSSKKLTDFLQKHMSDVVEISREGTTNIIVAKSKRKETVTVNKQSTCISKDAKQRGSALTPEAFIDFPPLGSEPLRPNHLTVPSSFPGNQRQRNFMALTPPAPTFAALPLMRSKPLRPNHQSMPSTGSCAGTNIRQQLNPRQQHPNVKNVNDTVKKIIDELAEEHFVDVELVKNKLFQQCKIKRLRDLGLRDNDVPALQDLIRKQREVMPKIIC